MEFDLVDDIKSFCGTYAFTKGFGWKIRNSKRGLDEQLHYLVLACTQEGNCVSKISPALKTLSINIAKYDAKVTTSKRQNGVWCIKKVVLDHSHDLSPTKARMFNENKSISLHMKRIFK